MVPISYLKKLLCVSIVLASPILEGMPEALNPQETELCKAALRGRFDLVEKEIAKGENPNCFYSPQRSLLDIVIRTARSVPENPCVRAEWIDPQEYMKRQKNNYIKTAQLLYQNGADVHQNRGKMLPKYLKGPEFAQRVKKDRLALYEKKPEEQEPEALSRWRSIQ